MNVPGNSQHIQAAENSLHIYVPKKQSTQPRTSTYLEKVHTFNYLHIPSWKQPTHPPVPPHTWKLPTHPPTWMDTAHASKYLENCPHTHIPGSSPDDERRERWQGRRCQGNPCPWVLRRWCSSSARSYVPRCWRWSARAGGRTWRCRNPAGCSVGSPPVGGKGLKERVKGAGLLTTGFCPFGRDNQFENF